MVQFPDGDPLRDNRTQIREFVETVKLFLEGLMEERIQGNDNSPLFIEELFPDVQRAWVEASPHFDEVISDLETLTGDAIHRHGLYGEQLAAKMNVVRYFADQFIQAGLSSILNKLLDAINNLLDSILGAINGGSAVSEMKDLVKSILRDD